MPRFLMVVKRSSRTAFAPTLETGSEAAPESPASAFENALTRHVLGPLARTMESIPIAFHCKAPSFPPFNYEIDSKSSTSHLWLDPIAPLCECIEHVPFEIGLTSFAEHCGPACVLAERLTEMPDSRPSRVSSAKAV